MILEILIALLLFYPAALLLYFLAICAAYLIGALAKIALLTLGLVWRAVTWPARTHKAWVRGA